MISPFSLIPSLERPKFDKPPRGGLIELIWYSRSKFRQISTVSENIAVSRFFSSIQILFKSFCGLSWPVHYATLWYSISANKFI